MQTSFWLTNSSADGDSGKCIWSIWGRAWVCPVMPCTLSWYHHNRRGYSFKEQQVAPDTFTSTVQRDQAKQTQQEEEAWRCSQPVREGKREGVKGQSRTKQTEWAAAAHRAGQPEQEGTHLDQTRTGHSRDISDRRITSQSCWTRGGCSHTESFGTLHSFVIDLRLVINGSSMIIYHI